VSILSKKPFLSICIPTYNRANFLAQCLHSIMIQLRKDRSLFKQVEIIISDNNSLDKTANLVKRYQKQNKAVRYYRNKKNIGADRNIIKSASYAKGDFIWFFSDDDVQMPYSLKILLQILQQEKPDASLCNLELCSKDLSTVLNKNLLKIDRDIILRTKKELFGFLESKFFLPIDWYTTCLSNTIISKHLFQQNLSSVMKLYDSSQNAFLHSGFIYYNRSNDKIYIISKPLVKFRADNRSFGPDEKNDKLNYLIYIHRVFRDHNHTIYKINSKYMSLRFKVLLFLKDFFRSFRITLLKYFHFDVERLAINFFR